MRLDRLLIVGAVAVSGLMQAGCAQQTERPVSVSQPPPPGPGSAITASSADESALPLAVTASFHTEFPNAGMTRVVQSAGRVIRSETDVGLIALLCKRFAQETYARYFPADWYDESPRELVTRKPAAEIRAFFEAKTTAQLSIRLF